MVDDSGIAFFSVCPLSGGCFEIFFGTSMNNILQSIIICAFPAGSRFRAWLTLSESRSLQMNILDICNHNRLAHLTENVLSNLTSMFISKLGEGSPLGQKNAEDSPRFH
jgi:hypothetical protein